MGQSASSPTKSPPVQGKFARVRNLKNKELKALCEMITEDEVKLFANTLNASINVSGFYTEEQDSIETELAKRLLTVSKPLAILRFKLVPSKLKENLFWKAVFGILEESTVTLEAEKQIMTDKEESPGNKSPSKKSNGQHRSLVSKARIHRSQTTTVTVVEELKNILEHREREITILMQKLDNANKEINRLSSSRMIRTTEPKKNGSSGVSTAVSATDAPRAHKGEWIMEKDSLDFLEYPEELKQNMRAEKKKRLEEVRNQMRFILDSDEICDSNGRWSCCENTIYSSSCNR